AVFAVHPLHVESVAWVTERKDVLSALFWLLAVLAHARYVERPTMRHRVEVAACAAAAVMAKPMAVTLPLTLLVVDYWPLGRLRGPSGMVAWGAKEFLAARPVAWRRAAAAAAAGALAGLGALAWAQTRTWRDGETVFAHALAVTRDNPLARHDLAVAYAEQGR